MHAAKCVSTMDNGNRICSAKKHVNSDTIWNSMQSARCVSTVDNGSRICSAKNMPTATDTIWNSMQAAKCVSLMDNGNRICSAKTCNSDTIWNCMQRLPNASRLSTTETEFERAKHANSDTIWNVPNVFRLWTIETEFVPRKTCQQRHNLKQHAPLKLREERLPNSEVRWWLWTWRYIRFQTGLLATVSNRSAANGNASHSFRIECGQRHKKTLCERPNTLTAKFKTTEGSPRSGDAP